MIEPYGEKFRYKHQCTNHRTWIEGPFSTEDEAEKALKEHIKKEH